MSSLFQVLRVSLSGPLEPWGPHPDRKTAAAWAALSCAGRARRGPPGRGRSEGLQALLQPHAVWCWGAGKQEVGGRQRVSWPSARCCLGLLQEGQKAGRKQLFLVPPVLQAGWTRVCKGLQLSAKAPLGPSHPNQHRATPASAGARPSPLYAGQTRSTPTTMAVDWST